MLDKKTIERRVNMEFITILTTNATETFILFCGVYGEDVRVTENTVTKSL